MTEFPGQVITLIFYHLAKVAAEDARKIAREKGVADPKMLKIVGKNAKYKAQQSFALAHSMFYRWGTVSNFWAVEEPKRLKQTSVEISTSLLPKWYLERKGVMSEDIPQRTLYEVASFCSNMKASKSQLQVQATFLGRRFFDSVVSDPIRFIEKDIPLTSRLSGILCQVALDGEKGKKLLSSVEANVVFYSGLQEAFVAKENGTLVAYVDKYRDKIRADYEAIDREELSLDTDSREGAESSSDNDNPDALSLNGEKESKSSDETVNHSDEPTDEILEKVVLYHLQDHEQKDVKRVLSKLTKVQEMIKPLVDLQSQALVINSF